MDHDAKTAEAHPQRSEAVQLDYEFSFDRLGGRPVVAADPAATAG